MNNNQLMTLEQVVSMTSLEIAELTGKEHRNVLADVKKMLTELDRDVLSFQQIFLDSMNREQTMYRLDKELTLTLVTGYSVKLRHAVIKRVELLESQVKRLEDVKKRAAVQSANRRGVTWGDFCKTNGLSAQKVLKALLASQTIIRIRANNEVEVNPKYADCFRVIKATDRRFSRSGLNFRFTAKGLERFSSPKAKAKLIEHYMKLGKPTAKEYREWCQSKVTNI